MKAAIERVGRQLPDVRVVLEVVDIAGNAELEAAYGLEIPVLLIDGAKAAKVRVSDADLRRKMLSRSPTSM
jgi:hypothetical protein